MMLPSAPPLPSAFRPSELLRWLGVAAAGFALAACTWPIRELGGIAVPISTLFYGLIWARFVRLRAGRIPIGWLASVPLAAMNAGTACAFSIPQMASLVTRGDVAECFGPFVMGASVGAIVWLPALVATLVLFGLPLFFAERAAHKGITGDDHGAVVVGSASTFYCGLMLLWLMYEKNWALASHLQVLPLARALAAVGLVAGLLCVVLARARIRIRRVFLNRVRTGIAPGYRLEPVRTVMTARLVRVTEEGVGYRETALVEPLFEIDEHGDAGHAGAAGRARS
jgi:hypothetical protein